MGKMLFLVPVVLVLLLFSAGCVPLESVPTVRLVENEIKEKPVYNDLPVGEELVAGGWQVTLCDYHWVIDTSSSAKKLITDWEFTNVSDREQFLSMTLIADLYNAKGEKQDELERNGLEKVAYRGVKPGETWKIRHGWEVEKGEGPFTLELTLGGLYQQETLIWLFEE